MGIPIVDEIVNIIRTIISTATSTIGQLISVAPPAFKVVMFLFLISFVGGVVVNWSFGTYYTCYDGDLWQPNNLFSGVKLKALQFIDTSEDDLDYCTGTLDETDCREYYDKTSCECFCPEVWDMATNDECASCNSSFWCDLWGDYVLQGSCSQFNETCCTIGLGCTWVSSYEDTPFYSRLQSLAEPIEVDDSGIYVGCSGDDGDDVSIFLGGLDVFSWETALALVLITVCLGIFTWVKGS